MQERFPALQCLLSVATPFFKKSHSRKKVVLEFSPRASKKRGTKKGDKRGKKGESPLGDRRRNDFLHFSYCFQLPHRSLKYRSRAMRSSFHYDPKQQEKMGKKGKTGDISLNDRCRNVFLHAIFSFNYYTVLQNIAVVQRGCLSFFCPDHKKRGKKWGNKKK